MTHQDLAKPVNSLGRARPYDAERLAVAVDVMQSRPAETHTVSTLAKLVGMSRSNFAEAFRQSFGRSPMEFLRTTRLEHAARLLRTSSMPVKTVGATVGYDSRTSFALAFKRAFAVSPFEFRSAQPGKVAVDIHALSERVRKAEGAPSACVWEVNLSSGAVWWSEGIFTALGYGSRRPIVCDVARFYERIHPTDRERIARSVTSACGGNLLTWDGEFDFREADGSYVRVANGCIILRDENGSAIRLIGVMQIMK